MFREGSFNLINHRSIVFGVSEISFMLCAYIFRSIYSILSSTQKYCCLVCFAFCWWGLFLIDFPWPECILIPEPRMGRPKKLGKLYSNTTDNIQFQCYFKHECNQQSNGPRKVVWPQKNMITQTLSEKHVILFFLECQKFLSCFGPVVYLGSIISLNEMFISSIMFSMQKMLPYLSCILFVGLISYWLSTTWVALVSWTWDVRTWKNEADYILILLKTFKFNVLLYLNVTKKAMVQGRLFELRKTWSDKHYQKSTWLNTRGNILNINIEIFHERAISGTCYRLYLEKHESKAENHIQIEGTLARLGSIVML